jgi:hypothetical protein
VVFAQAKQQEVSLLKRRGSDRAKVRAVSSTRASRTQLDAQDGRRSSIAPPPSTVRATSKASTRSSLATVARSSLKQLPPTPSIYEETPIRPQHMTNGKALYAQARRPGGTIEEKENRVPMLA